jgi:hypothetical protein
MNTFALNKTIQTSATDTFISCKFAHNGNIVVATATETFTFDY